MPDEPKSNSLQPAQPNKLQPIAAKADALGNPVFSDYGEMRRWAFARIQGGGLPKHVQTAENLESCIFLLAGLGLNVMASIGNTMIVNGVLGIWGDLPEALCRRTGELEDIELFWTNDKDERLDPEKPFAFAAAKAAVCKVKRKGQSPVVRSFTSTQADMAGLSKKPGPWQQYPQTMLGHRARGLALRAAFPDALKGVRINEVDEYVEMTGPGGNPLRTDEGHAVLRSKKKAGDELFSSLGERARQTEEH